MSEHHLTIVVPAYNEEVRLQPNLAKISEFYESFGMDFDVMVVSDGSSDKTNQLVEEFASDHPKFALNAYTPNRGKGYAVRTGMLSAKGDWILFMDADLATPLEETKKLLDKLGAGSPIAIGSRPMRESELEVHQPIWREALGRASNKLVQLLAVRGITDTQCGFKAFTREAAQEVFTRCTLNGFSFDFEALMIARDLGLHIDEVPIRWAHQEGSKVVFWRDYPRALKDLVSLRMRGKAKRLEKHATG
jgi:dolichyl-phosphate beta-glucosyltransferase